MGSIVARILKKLLNRPFYPIEKLICLIRSGYLSFRYVDKGNGRIEIMEPFVRFKVYKDKGAILVLYGKFRVSSHLHGKALSKLILKGGSVMEVNGDFIIGHGVTIFLSKNSFLKLGGRLLESDSGITADTLIMVERKIEIGTDFLCAWNVFISDSDWHYIIGQDHQKDVIIGDHVWVANNSSVLKGAVIPQNCIVASHSKVTGRNFTVGSMLAGIPAKTVKEDVSWSRDIPADSTKDI